MFILFVLNVCLVPHVDNTNANIRTDDQVTKKPFTLEEIYLQLYRASGFNGTWISDTEIMVTKTIKSDITVYNVVTKKNKRIFDGSTLPVRMFYNLSCNLILERLQFEVGISLSSRYYDKNLKKYALLMLSIKIYSK